MGPSERAHRRCAKKSAVAGLYMGMVMMGIGWRGALIQAGAVNRALTSYDVASRDIAHSSNRYFVQSNRGSVDSCIRAGDFFADSTSDQLGVAGL